MNKGTIIEGVYTLGKNDIGFVRIKGTEHVIEVPSHERATALNKDLVQVEVTDAEKLQGKVTQVIKRASVGFAGTLKKQGEHFVVHPDNFKTPDIIIPLNGNTFTIGNKVFATIDQYGDPLVGTIVEDLGKPGSNDAMMKGIALEQGFNPKFPPEVEEQAANIHDEGISQEVIAQRRDMRGSLTFTIDPADAKDFDDALSFVTLADGNYEIGIHIADVSHYVQPGTAIDQEAIKRTTSVYLVDRTVPMLPEILSNELCSIREAEDKLAFSAIFTIESTTGTILSQWFGRTIIKSDKRFNYEEAQEILDKGQGLHHHELSELNRLAKIFEQQRFKNGALNFDTNEVKFILDETGKPVDVKVKQRIDTNKLIEEFMLLANNKVAEYVQSIDFPFFVYRVHDRPDAERALKLRDFLHLLGYSRVELIDGIVVPKILQRILKEAEGTSVYDTLQTVIVRSMQKAIYTTKNIGHFGLAFDSYTHFTSPIRRYPDVLSHRLLQHALDHTAPDFDQAWHEKICDHASNQEQSAVTAERNSIKVKQVEYMAQRNKLESFAGIVTGASKFGVFVAEQHSLSEGMIRMGDLGNDLWEYREKTGTIIGKKTKKVFKIGDEVRIKIKNVDLEKNLIDYRLDSQETKKTV